MSTGSGYASLGERDMIPIIDTHQHLWDLNLLQLNWIKGAGALGKNHLMSDYVRDAQGLNITRTIYMEVDAVEEQHEVEAGYVLDLCWRPDNPMTAAVIGGRPDDLRFTEYMERFAHSPYIKGVRQVLHGGTKKGYCLDPEFVHGLRALGDLGLRFDLCMRPDELSDALQVCRECPNTLFVLDHCGNASVQPSDLNQWKREIEAVSKAPNIACKISGLVSTVIRGEWSSSDLDPIISHCVQVFGHDRIMFGSDWPICTVNASLREWVEALQQIVSSWSESDQRKLFHDNAARFYELN